MSLNRTNAVVLALALAAGAAAAQSFVDPFVYPPGTLIPGYTEQRGDWTIVADQVKAQAGISNQELTTDAVNDRDGCAEVLAIFDTAAPDLQRTGPILRHSGSGAPATYFMIKVQDNTTPYNAFDSYFVYWYNGTSFQSTGLTAAGLAPSTAIRTRLQVIEQTGGVLLQLFLDTNVDGKWDIVRSGVTTLGIGSSGRIGINGARGVIADDFKYFDATLYLDGSPSVGNPVNLKGRGTAGLGYVGACSLGHSGIPIGNGRSIPLDFDNLTLLSLTLPAVFQNFQGTTDANGDFTMTLNTPAVPALAGFTIWSSAVTFDQTGVREIAPDVEITFVP
jgi:hypothetical protein